MVFDFRATTIWVIGAFGCLHLAEDRKCELRLNIQYLGKQKI